MTSQAQCAYCFESLSASLEKRPSLSLEQVEELWRQFTGTSEETEETIDAADDNELVSPRPAAVSRLLAPSPASAGSSSASSSSSTPRSGSSASASKSSSRTSFFSSKSKEQEAAQKSQDDYPLFVTWNTIGKNGSTSLRGCIGTFEAQNLDDGLRSYALTSAFDDTRFLPVTLRELPTLECGVTLLTNFQPASDPMAWEVGKHGLRISFTNHGRRYGSTYLPDVAREQGWTKEETMVSLMRKAGWNGRRDEWRKVSDLNVVTYEGAREKLEYKEWKEFRDWLDSLDS